MIEANIHLGKNVVIELDSHVNNVKIGDNTRVAGRVKIFGSEEFQLEIGKNSYVGMNCFIEGFNAKVVIGEYVSFAPNVKLVSGSGPQASLSLQNIFPVIKGSVIIKNHCWIGGFATIMPAVTLGNYCVVAANSFVDTSFPDYSIIGGTPAKLIRTLTEEEIKKLHEDE